MITLENLTKRFGDYVAVREFSLEVRAGEFMTLLGPSGCGKSTVLRLVSGFETPDAGRIRLKGEDVTHTPPYRRNMNQVFQSYALFPHLTVWENVAFGLRMRKTPPAERRERVREALRLVALEGLEQRRPGQLSGGQRQRVALARAAVLRPDVLLLDEPLSALDAKLRHQMRFELKRLQQHLGITFIFVTHDQEEALTISDRIAVLDHGCLQQVGTPHEIYHRPKSRFVADFIGEANLLEATGEAGRLVLADGLRLELPAAEWPADQREVLISIRPEKIHLSREPAEGPNHFGAIIERVHFQGAFSKLDLRSDAGTRLHAAVANASAMRDAWREGERVTAALHVDDIVVLPPSAEAWARPAGT
jgi:spermidine/putrescine transport system ATP-binding protein